jgi:septum formation protein
MTVKRKLEDSKAGSNVHPILGADTIVVLEKKIMGKPSGRDEAVSTLNMLSGRTHSVITGVCILSAKKKIIFAEKTQVEFHMLSPEQIKYYVDKYKPYDKAGAYAIQEWIGVTGIRSISGDFYNVMGLPVSRVLKELEALG